MAERIAEHVFVRQNLPKIGIFRAGAKIQDFRKY